MEQLLQKEGGSLAPDVCKQRLESLMVGRCAGESSTEQVIRPQNLSTLETRR